MTASQVFTNNATTTVASGGTNAPAGGTSESWTVASSASFPAASTGVSQFHVADPAAATEKILVTNVSGTTWTVTRGAESTTPVSHSAGFTVNQVVTAGDLGGYAQAGLGDLGGTGAAPTVVSAHFAAPLAVAQGGTGSAAQNWENLLTPTGVKTAGYTAAAGDYVPVDTTGGAVTVTLPAAPANLTRVGVKMVAQTVPNAVTITCGGTDVLNIAGGPASMTLLVPDQGALLQYKASSGIWYVQDDDLMAIPDTSTLWSSNVRLPVVPQPSTVVTDFQPGHGWTGLAGATYNLNDTTAGHFIIGTQAVSMTTDGGGSNFATVRNLGGYSLNATGLNIRLRFKFDDITHLRQINVFFGSSSLVNNYKWIVFTQGVSTFITSGDWIVLTLSFIDATTHNTPNRASLTDVEWQCLDDGGGTVTCHLQSVELIPDGTQTFPKGVVSICFDDGYSSPMTTGAWLTLDSYGYPATLCTITDQLGAFPYMSVSDLKTRCDLFGWESAGHAYTGADHNTSDTGLSAQQLDLDARNQRNWLTANGLRGGDGYAYPLGNFGLTSDGQPVIGILRRYYTWNRTVSSFVHETWPPADRFRLRAISNISSFSGGVSAATINTLVNNTVTYGGWQILVFHKIVTSSPASVIECLLSDFNSIIANINSAGVPVMTVGDALRHYSQEIAAIDATAADIQPDSTQAVSAGSKGQSADAKHAHPRYDFQPSDHSLIAWSFDPAAAVSTATALATAGTQYAAKLHIPVAQPVTNIVTFLSAAGTTLTSGQCFAALYQGGNLLGTTADQSSAWTTSGIKTMAISGGPVTAATGDAYVTFWFNGTTGPAPLRGSSTGASNIGLASTYRWATANTAVTTSAPSSIGTLTSFSTTYWAAVS